MKKLFFILILFLISCQLPDNNTEYQEGLVVFGRIELVEINGTAIGEIDTIRVSLSSEIDANIGNTQSLYINDEKTLSYIYPYGNKKITKKITFYPNSFVFDLEIDMTPIANSLLEERFSPKSLKCKVRVAVLERKTAVVNNSSICTTQKHISSIYGSCGL